MGMSASQARLLFISSRMNDIEFKSQQISNQKIRLADDSEKVATKYSDALNKTRLMVNNPIDQSQSQLTYSSIMSPKGQMSGGYNLQTAQGKVVVSSTVASAFEKSRSLSQFLSALSVPQTAATLVEAQSNYNESVRNLHTAENNVKNFLNQYNLSVDSNNNLKFPTRQVWVEDSVSTNDSTSSVNTNDSSGSVSTNDSTSSVNTNDSSGSVSTNDSSSSVNTNDSSGSVSGVSHAPARRAFMMMDDQSYSGGGGGGGGGGVTTVTSPTVNVNDSVGSGGGGGSVGTSGSSSRVNSTDTTNSVNTNDTAGSISTNDTSNSSSQPTGHYETHDVYSTSEKASITANYQQLLNRLDKARNIYDTAVQALNEAQAGATTESSVGNEAYYTNLYNQMSSSGYEAYSQLALNSPDYLQYQLETGGWFLGKKDSDGSYKQTSISSTTMVVSASADKADIARAEAEYNAETAKINKKEKKLDNELKNLDTEHSALKTEFESVKSLIGENVEKSFNLFS